MDASCKNRQNTLTNRAFKCCQHSFDDTIPSFGSVPKRKQIVIYTNDIQNV